MNIINRCSELYYIHYLLESFIEQYTGKAMFFDLFIPENKSYIVFPLKLCTKTFKILTSYNKFILCPGSYLFNICFWGNQ